MNRREFVTATAATMATAAVAATAKSYAQILGANDRVNFAVAGLNGRGYAHLAAILDNSPRAHRAFCCDVDSRILDKFAAKASSVLGYAPTAVGDFRRALDSKDVDAITIATPEHWHTPMAILGLKAGKNVYVEKPSSHNCREGELLIAAQKKYGHCVQVGDQQRSSEHTIKIIGDIHAGLIGRAYAARSWYSNTRKSMGKGKPAPVPANLDWELWQGPAPRAAYKDNIHPYNWHWLIPYGTGETLNNGTHEVDICRWALDAGYPSRVYACGARYHFDDDWQFADTVTTTFDYKDKQITWECNSSNGMKQYNRDRGSVILGTNGSVLLDRGGYEVYDNNGKLIDQFSNNTHADTHDAVSRDKMTANHFANFMDGIRSGAPLHSPIQIAAVSVAMLLLSNISIQMGRSLTLDSSTGHILNDAEAMKHWGRSYEKGWEPTV